jgi:DNA-binding HxlR family transcriptional regulator
VHAGIIFHPFDRQGRKRRQGCATGMRGRSATGARAGRVLDRLGTKTAFLVVRECFYGTTRFEDFVARVVILK